MPIVNGEVDKGTPVGHKASLTSSTITGTITPDAKQYESDLTLTFTTKAGERALITFMGVARLEEAAGVAQCTMYLNIDDVQKNWVRGDIITQYYYHNMSFSYLTDALTAGSHTAKFYFAKKDAGDKNWSIRVAESAAIVLK